MNKILICVLAALLLVSCSKPLEIQLDPQVTVFVSSKSEETVELTKADQAYINLNAWLLENSDNWQTTSGRYEDGVYLTSGDRGIQITDSHVIIYTDIKRKPRAEYIQRVGKNELLGWTKMAK